MLNLMSFDLTDDTFLELLNVILSLFTDLQSWEENLKLWCQENMEKLSMLKNGALHQLTTGPATVAPPPPKSEYRVLAGLSTFESHIGHFVGCFLWKPPWPQLEQMEKIQDWKHY